MNLDRCELFEFYPGDVVRVEDTENIDDEYLYYAKSLISTLNPEERLYREFLFYSMTYQIEINQETLGKFNSAINRAQDEIDSGLFVYRRTRETIKMLVRIRLGVV